MFYRLYLKRKLQKNSSEYICIFIIIIIAAMLIVIPSVFLDSIRYGEKLHVEYLTDGYDAVLVGAKESDEAYFNEVERICQSHAINPAVCPVRCGEEFADVFHVVTVLFGHFIILRKYYQEKNQKKP